MRAALKALSYPDIDIRKSYPLKRQIDTAVGKKIGAAYETWDHTVQCGDHEVPVRLFASGNGADDRILLFFHGGGWVTGNIDSYNKICCQMAEATGHLVVSVDYRLAPEHRFPQGLEDCYAVAREVCLDASLFGVSARRITLIGDSAGGNLAAAVSLMARDRGEFLPARQILIYPATWNDHTPASPFRSVTENGTDYLLTSRRICDYMELYRSSAADLQNPYFAPLLAEDFTGLPETLVVTAQYDPLRDEGEEYAARLAEAGGDVVCRRMPDALHGFLALPPQFAQVGRIYEWINAFLREREERV
ncbi:alpha/beta hydrolase [Anaerotruncus sp. X29]|nr:alpha/beta hydrolase [Anaerotruncus sp. X29]